MPNENEKDDDLDEDEFVDDMSKDGKNKIVDDDMDDEDKMSGEKVETRKCPKCGGTLAHFRLHGLRPSGK